jgi:phage baseplate assembly protein W
MSGDFLGVGWNFPVQVDEGRVRVAAYEESVRQSIWTILSTSKGERVMRPDFGCGLDDLVFSLNNATTSGRVAFEVRHALDRWEPRIETTSVTVNSPFGSDVLEINIECHILRTNTRFNLVFPFYLRMGRETS